MKWTIIIICVILLVVLICMYRKQLKSKSKQNEQFGEELSKYNPYDYVDITQQFDDIVVYNNEPTGRTGFDQCIEKCHGYCVEYGLTGDAHCYKLQQTQEKDFGADVVQNDNKLVYPNVKR